MTQHFIGAPLKNQGTNLFINFLQYFLKTGKNITSVKSKITTVNEHELFPAALKNIYYLVNTQRI